MSQNITPLHDRIIIKRLEDEQTTISGIIIPDTAKEKTQFGEVVSTGPGKKADNGKLATPAVKAGDKVIFSKYAGTEIKFEGSDLLIIKEDEILGIIQ